jgi:methionyl-tRNA synthetase
MSFEGKINCLRLKNQAVWLHEYLEEFESARCFALCFNIECTETKDNDFTWKDFQARNNNE